MDNVFSTNELIEIKYALLRQCDHYDSQLSFYNALGDQCISRVYRDSLVDCSSVLAKVKRMLED